MAPFGKGAEAVAVKRGGGGGGGGGAAIRLSDRLKWIAITVRTHLDLGRMGVNWIGPSEVTDWGSNPCSRHRITIHDTIFVNKSECRAYATNCVSTNARCRRSKIEMMAKSWEF